MICWLSLACHTYTCGRRNLDSNFVFLFTFSKFICCRLHAKTEKTEMKKHRSAGKQWQQRERKIKEQKIEKIDVITFDIQFNAPSNDCRWFVRQFKFIVNFFFLPFFFIHSVLVCFVSMFYVFRYCRAVVIVRLLFDKLEKYFFLSEIKQTLWM